MNRYGGVDVIIVGRGGGSLEDLWAFNEEIVARAIYASEIPIVSAVGHEIDFTIADFVADLRAPTPSAAAEMVVPDRLEILEVIRNYEYTIRQMLTQRMASHRERIASLIGSHTFNRPKDMVREFVQRLDELRRTMSGTFSHGMEKTALDADSLSKRLLALSPQRALKRGYAIVRKNGVPVTHARQLVRNDEASVEFQDGKVSTKVQ
jgi:exodeoxyribonuclease VII large subunit